MEFTDLDNGRRQRTQTTEAMELTDLNIEATEPTEKTESALLFARLTGPPLAPGRWPGPEGGSAIRTRKRLMCGRPRVCPDRPPTLARATRAHSGGPQLRPRRVMFSVALR